MFLNRSARPGCLTAVTAWPASSETFKAPRLRLSRSPGVPPVVPMVGSSSLFFRFIVRFNGPSSFFAISYFICTSRFWGLASVRAQDGIGASTLILIFSACSVSIGRPGPMGSLPSCKFVVIDSAETFESRCSANLRLFSARDWRNSARLDASFRLLESRRKYDMDLVNYIIIVRPREHAYDQEELADVGVCGSTPL